MRDLYHHDLDSIFDDLVSMTHAVEHAVARATEALLRADGAIAEEVIAADGAIDQSRERIEQHSFEILALQQPVASDLRMLVAALRMASDLERMGDLSVHVAKVARLRIPSVAVPEALRPTISRMAVVAESMVEAVAHVILERDVEAAFALEAADDEMDSLRRSSFRLVLDVTRGYNVEEAVDVALLGRYYERIADHAVSLARRVVFLVTGEVPSPAPAPM